MMKVLVVKPHEEPFVHEIDGSLQSMQALVGGYIEVIHPFDDPDAILVCNEEGKLDGLAPNRPLKDSSGNTADIICGDFFIAGDGGEDFISLSDEQVEKYTKLFELDTSRRDRPQNIVQEVSVSKEDSQIEKLMLKVCHKAALEFDKFIKDISWNDTEKIIDAAYEIVIKQDILTAFQTEHFSLKEAKALHTLDEPLFEIYREWLKNDCSNMQQIRDTISGFAAELPNKEKYSREER